MTNNYSCPICKSNSSKHMNDVIYYDCIRCGYFFIDPVVLADFKRELSDGSIAAKISGWIKENQKVKIDSRKFEWLVKNLTSISVHEKAQRLLRWLNKKTIYPSQPVMLKINITDEEFASLLSICWAYNQDEIMYLIRYLSKENLIVNGTYGSDMGLTITPDGFTYLENIENNFDSNIGFCAMWFNSSMDVVWEQGFEPAIKQAGYRPIRIDKKPHNGVVVDEIISSIRQSKFIIADLTGERGGVYFEAGFAKGHGIEVIFTCRNDIDINNLHFDVRHFNFLIWENDKYEALRSSLSLRIESTLGKGKYYSDL